METVYICAAFRTPIGTFTGQYSNMCATKLGSCVLFHCLQRARIKPSEVSEVIMGHVLTAGLGQNPARQAAVLAKIPPDVPASTINMACGSGLRAIYSGFNAIRAREGKIILAGGQENSSLSHHVVNLKTDRRIGHIEVKDSILQDGNTCALLNKHIGAASEDLAAAFDIPREIQDKYTLMSHFRAVKAADNGYFINEVIPTHEHIAFLDINIDEGPKRDLTLDALADIVPLFEQSYSSDDFAAITLGNSSSPSDGAAAVLLAGRSEVLEKNLYPQAAIIAMVQIGCDPTQTGLAHISAIKKLLDQAHWTLEEVDLYEINDAFAAETMICVNVLDLDLTKVNVSGGAIALGNPIGGSGARIVVTLVHNLERLEKAKGVAAMCIGGGMAIAIAIQRCEGSGSNVSFITSCKK